jgi:regulatory protein
MPSKTKSKEEILFKLQRYCTYQDRCHQEVRTKLLKLEVYGDLLEEIIVELIKDNFLNEERFAKSFSRGKFRQKKWGKVKISNQLMSRNISEYCINRGLQEIDEEEYIDSIKTLIEYQLEKNSDLQPIERKHKCYQYLIRKGYEVDLVLQYLPD